MKPSSSATFFAQRCAISFFAGAHAGDMGSSKKGRGYLRRSTISNSMSLRAEARFDNHSTGLSAKRPIRVAEITMPMRGWVIACFSLVLDEHIVRDTIIRPWTLLARRHSFERHAQFCSQDRHLPRGLPGRHGNA